MNSGTRFFLYKNTEAEMFLKIKNMLRIFPASLLDTGKQSGEY